MDAYIASATEQEWKELQEKEVRRAHETCCRLMKSNLTLDEFRKVWYSQTEDKKGLDHIANMCMSIFQSRKVRAGNSFEAAIEQLHLMGSIIAKYQVLVDSDGNIHSKKPSRSVHKHDCLIAHKDSTNIQDMIVISIKTTLRERFREDLDSVTKCKKVIFLTREIPEQGHLDSLKGYNCILVYQNAPLTDHTWSYSEYVSRIKHFQQTGSYSFS